MSGKNAAMSQRAQDDKQAARDLNDLLLRVARNKDKSAFIALFEEMAPKLKAYLMRTGSDAAAAEELVQDVMLTIWRKAETFDPRQANAATWIFTIARNRRIDRFRRENRPDLDPEEPMLLPSAPDQADDVVSLSQDSERLAAALRTLPTEQAELLEKAFYEDKAHSAIAEETGLPLGTVKSRIRLALNRLRKNMLDETQTLN